MHTLYTLRVARKGEDAVLCAEEGENGAWYGGCAEQGHTCKAFTWNRGRGLSNATDMTQPAEEEGASLLSLLNELFLAYTRHVDSTHTHNMHVGYSTRMWDTQCFPRKPHQTLVLEYGTGCQKMTGTLHACDACPEEMGPKKRREIPSERARQPDTSTPFTGVTSIESSEISRHMRNFPLCFSCACSSAARLQPDRHTHQRNVLV